MNFYLYFIYWFFWYIFILKIKILKINHICLKSNQINECIKKIRFWVQTHTNAFLFLFLCCWLGNKCAFERAFCYIFSSGIFFKTPFIEYSRAKTFSAIVSDFRIEYISFLFVVKHTNGFDEIRLIISLLEVKNKRKEKILDK